MLFLLLMFAHSHTHKNWRNFLNDAKCATRRAYARFFLLFLVIQKIVRCNLKIIYFFFGFLSCSWNESLWFVDWIAWSQVPIHCFCYFCFSFFIFKYVLCKIFFSVFLFLLRFHSFFLPVDDDGDDDEICRVRTREVKCLRKDLRAIAGVFNFSYFFLSLFLSLILPFSLARLPFVSGYERKLIFITWFRESTSHSWLSLHCTQTRNSTESPPPPPTYYATSTIFIFVFSRLWIVYYGFYERINCCRCCCISVMSETKQKNKIISRIEFE